MPHLTGVFEEFPDLDKVTSAQIGAWLVTKPEVHTLANFFGNRLLYPQTVAVNEMDMTIDLAILREAVRQKPTVVSDPQRSKLYIPEAMVLRFPPLSRLAGVLIEALSPKGVNQIYVKNKNQVKLVGTLISPPDLKKMIEDKTSVRVAVDGVENKLNLNTISISPITSPEVNIKIETQDFKVFGGELGVIIDLRVSPND
jgi:hypothetical protein